MAIKGRTGRRITALCLGLLLAVQSPFGGYFSDTQSVSGVYAANIPAGYSKIAQNQEFNLYMCEDDLSLIVEDKESGATMSSAITYDDGKNNNTWLGAMKSAVVLTFINGNDDSKQADLVNDEVRKTITSTANGFRAELLWNKYSFGLTLEVELTDEGLTAYIADESIVENSDNYRIGTIAIYPFMGNSYLDEKEGYLLVPDGNGALIYLDDKEGRFSVGYSEMIYGKDIGFEDSSVTSLLWDRYEMVTDAEKIIAPVYGIAHTDDGIAYLAIVEEGDERATIEAHPNGVSVDYNRAYAKFIERKLYTQPTSNNSTSGSLHLAESDRSHSDLRIRFLFLSGDKANYAGMANAYREYLLQNGLLEIQEDDYQTRVDFLGTEREKWVIGTSTVVMTTTDDIRDIYDDLASAGVTDIFSVYKGWQKGGLYDIPITSYKADPGIGGTSSLTALIKDAESRGISFYLYNNALWINPDEQNASFNVVKQINKRRYSFDTYKDVYETMMYLTPARSKTVLNRFINSYTAKGIDHLCVAGISDTVFSYSYSGVNYSRYECSEDYRALVGEVNERAGLVLEHPFAYLWKDTEAFLDMPMYTSSYIVEDESVPFLSIVLKGVMPVYSEYINFEANKNEFFLKLVETGTYPSFYITRESSSNLINTNSCDIYSSEYDVYRDMIISYTEELKAFNEEVAGARILRHEIMDSGVTVVGYDNGKTVYLNYTDTQQTVNGVTIEAMSYEVL